MMRKVFRHHLTVMAFIPMSLVSSSLAGEPSNHSGMRRLNRHARSRRGFSNMKDRCRIRQGIEHSRPGHCVDRPAQLLIEDKIVAFG
jgi:hypothetical protein